jgi:hypothetical protein
MRALAACMLAAALGAAIWGLSPVMTGRFEPWDTESLYYPAALILAGLASGSILPRPRWAHYAGVCTGQFAYELLFLEQGPLLLLGVLFLLGYGVIFLAGATVAGMIRHRFTLSKSGPTL